MLYVLAGSLPAARHKLRDLGRDEHDPSVVIVSHAGGLRGVRIQRGDQMELAFDCPVELMTEWEVLKAQTVIG